jgi:hypothetical protein
MTRGRRGDGDDPMPAPPEPVARLLMEPDVAGQLLAIVERLYAAVANGDAIETRAAVRALVTTWRVAVAEGA